MTRFKERKLSWYKRRTPGEEPHVVSFEFLGFEKRKGHPCSIRAVYSDGCTRTLSARVHVNEIHTLGCKEPERGRWTVQGINHKGINVLLEVLDEDPE